LRQVFEAIVVSHLKDMLRDTKSVVVIYDAIEMTDVEHHYVFMY